MLVAYCWLSVSYFLVITDYRYGANEEEFLFSGVVIQEAENEEEEEPHLVKLSDQNC